MHIALHLIVIAGDADGLDGLDFQLARDDAGGDQAAAGDGDDAIPVIAFFDQTPGQRLAIAVELVPGDQKTLRGGFGGVVGHEKGILRKILKTRNFAIFIQAFAVKAKGLAPDYFSL